MPLRLDLPNRPREPAMSPDKPRTEREQSDDSDRDSCVVQGLRSDRVGSRKAEDDGDEANPGHTDKADNPRHEAQGKGTFDKVLVVYDRNEDRNAVRDIESDGRDGSGGGECHRRPQGGEGEAEREEGSEPDCPVSTRVRL